MNELELSLTIYEQAYLDFITSNPTLEQIATYRLADEQESRLSELLEKSHQGRISAPEAEELETYARLEHFMRLVKYTAYRKLTA